MWWKRSKQNLANTRLIQVDIERLLQILYRIDIHQQDSDEAFDLGEINLISKALAQKIVARQLKKWDYSQKFNQKK